MRFNPKARIDTSRISDAGGSRTGGGTGGGSGGGSSAGPRRSRLPRRPGRSRRGQGGRRGLPVPANLGGGVGGGIGGVVLVVVILVLTQVIGGGDDDQQGAGQTGTSIETGDTDRYASCQTGADANSDPDCARAIVEDSLTSFWSQVLTRQQGLTLDPPRVRTFTDATATGGCGRASAAVGPFYCPTDQTIYLDTAFFTDVLEGQLGGRGGDFVEPYVLAHEYGHHIQEQLGTMARVRTQQGPDSDAVRLELQADCYAGMWARGALETTDDSGVRIFDSLDQADINEALDAAKTVGDDLIQQRSGRRVDPEGWTHGSSEQRQRWFRTGYGAVSMSECDTFAADTL